MHHTVARGASLDIILTVGVVNYSYDYPVLRRSFQKAITTGSAQFCKFTSGRVWSIVGHTRQRTLSTQPREKKRDRFTGGKLNPNYHTTDVCGTITDSTVHKPSLDNRSLERHFCSTIFTGPNCRGYYPGELTHTPLSTLPSPSALHAWRLRHLFVPKAITNLS